MQQITVKSGPSQGPAGPPQLKYPWARVLNRTTFGYKAEDEDQIRSMGIESWINSQLLPLQIDDTTSDAALSDWPWIDGSAHDAAADPSLAEWTRADLFRGIRFLRAVHSKRQLLERTVEFWTDHFNVKMGPFLRIFDDKTVWRPNAFAPFRDLLGSIVRSGSMLGYLDNDENRAGAPNENLARELLELHTLGVNGAYTETDVREFARALTGWTFVTDPAAVNYGAFLYDDSVHDQDPKMILGLQFDGTTGPGELEDVLDLLAMHPDTIQHVTAKLGRWFLGDETPGFALDAARASWLNTGGDIREVIRSLLTMRAFRALDSRASSKFRRPFDWFAAVIRGTGVTPPSADQSFRIVQKLGQAPFQWPAPDGFPDTRERWGGLVQPRWEIAASFVRPELGEHVWNHTTADLMALVQGVPRPDWALHLNFVLTGGRLSRSDVLDLQNFVASDPSTTDEEAFAEALEVAICCPSFQLV